MDIQSKKIIRKTFEERAEEVRKFKEEKGRLPKEKETNGGWVISQRRWLKGLKNKKTEEISKKDRTKIKILKELGITVAKTFEEKVEEVRKFKGKNGRLPKWKEPNSVWIHNQRQWLKDLNNKKPEEISEKDKKRIKILEKLGIVVAKTFDERIEEVRKFKEENERLPIWKEPNGVWIQFQRQWLKGLNDKKPEEISKKDKTRMKILEESGITIATVAKTFEERAEEVRKFVEESGRLPKGKEINGDWVISQRQWLKGLNDKKPEEISEKDKKRMKILEKLGITIERILSKKTFDERIEEIKEFEKEKGRIPKVRETNGGWIHNQKQWLKGLKDKEPGQISEEDRRRIEILKGLGIEYLTLEEKQKRKQELLEKQKKVRAKRKK